MYGKMPAVAYQDFPEARLIIKEEAGSALDPTLVDMFLKILDEEAPLAEVAPAPFLLAALLAASGIASRRMHLGSVPA